MEISRAEQISDIQGIIPVVEAVLDKWWDPDNTGVHPADKNSLVTVREILRDMAKEGA